MSHQSETPFDNLESSHEYIALLADAIQEALGDVDELLSAAITDSAERRQEALHLVNFNLNKLSFHVTSSRRILNDLRLLRRVLLEERTLAGAVSAKTRTGGAS